MEEDKFRRIEYNNRTRIGTNFNENEPRKYITTISGVEHRINERIVMIYYDVELVCVCLPTELQDKLIRAVGFPRVKEWMNVNNLDTIFITVRKQLKMNKRDEKQYYDNLTT